MSVDMNREPAQPEGTERRTSNGDRVPFEGVVEVEESLGPSFEAQALDVSEEGIHLRTAYLPELGQPLTCRIEVGSDVVLAAGEVVWRREAERGGDFGMRFTDLDPPSVAALKKLLTVEPAFTVEAGSRVRLHIEGLGSPMRARIRGSAVEGLVVGSELGFLQVGKELELEDATSGGKRAARIHRVGVEVNPETQIPQLVVSLRYDVTDADVPVTTSEAAAGGPEDTPEPSVIDDEKPRATMRGVGASPRSKAKAVLVDESEDDDLAPMRSNLGEAFHRASAKMGPFLLGLGARAKTTMGLVKERARSAAKGNDEPPRRTTAPPPAGALHATGRKVVRGEPASAMEALEGKPTGLVTRRRLAVGGAVAVAAVLGLAAVHKPSATAHNTTPAADPAALGNAGPSTSPPASAGAPMPTGPGSVPPIVQPPEGDTPATVNPAVDDSKVHKKPGHVTPFGNGPVAHGNILHLKMDGVIEKIEGATTPTGFNVVVPDRRSLEAAAPLAARDSRIAAIRITNEANGAELAVTFKDGVPNYQVRARGDSLEIVLASRGGLPDSDEPTKPARKKHPALKH